MFRKLSVTSICAASFFVSAPALADGPPGGLVSSSLPSVTAGPRVGGHLGFALPLLTIADPVQGIGADFVKIGITPGVTFKLDDKWSIDFEFIAFNDLKDSGHVTTWIVDPGVIYAAGPVSAGLRIATEVAARTNIGLVPIVVLPVVKIGDKFTYYVEGDLPMFLRDGAPDGLKPSIGLQLQSGIAF